MDRLDKALERDGYVHLNSGLKEATVELIEGSLRKAGGNIRTSRGTDYAVRNLEGIWPSICSHVCPVIIDTLHAAVGLDCGLVRALLFDKPPGRSWVLGWHKDLSIAIRRHLSSSRFSKPTFKAGIPHVEAPLEVLEGQIAVRIHLDPVTQENGPLEVVPGSHREGKSVGRTLPSETILAKRGDVLFMRPLLVHRSGRSHIDAISHRRVLHLEFHGTRTLPEGWEWQTFIPVS